MIAAGVEPNEVTLISLVRKAESFEAGCELATFSRTEKKWYTGQGFYSALFSLRVTHLTAKQLIDVFLALPFRFNTSLANPIRQYRRDRLPEQAFEICLNVPELPTVRKFYKERGTFCLPHFATLEEHGFEHEHFDYCYGLALLVNGHVGDAKLRLETALSNALSGHLQSKISSVLAEI